LNGDNGNGPDGKKRQKQTSAIESLVKRHHDLFIDSGSPLTMKLQAPLKIGFNPPAAPSAEVAPPVPEAMPQGQRAGEASQPAKLTAPPPPEGEFARPAASAAQPVGQVAQPSGLVAPPAPPVIPSAGAATTSPVNTNGQSSNKQSDSSLLPFLSPGGESSSSSSTSKKSSSESSSHSSTTTVPIQPSNESQF
jgi:hypothetical protein